MRELVNLLKDADTRITFIVWIIMLASLPIAAYVFHKDLTDFLRAVAGLFIIVIPWYGLHRIKQNKKKSKVRYDITTVIEECIVNLSHLSRNVAEFSSALGQTQSRKSLRTFLEEYLLSQGNEILQTKAYVEAYYNSVIYDAEGVAEAEELRNAYKGKPIPDDFPQELREVLKEEEYQPEGLWQILNSKDLRAIKKEPLAGVEELDIVFLEAVVNRISSITGILDTIIKSCLEYPWLSGEARLVAHSPNYLSLSHEMIIEEYYPSYNNLLLHHRMIIEKYH